MQIDISLKTPENWTAHDRRDAIEKLMTQAALHLEKIHKDVLRVWEIGNLEEAERIRSLPFDRIARFSFAFKGLETFDFSISPVYIDGMKDICMEKIAAKKKEMDKFFLMRPINWMIGKLLDEKERKSVEDEITSELFKKKMESWETAVISGYVAVLRPFFDEFEGGDITVIVKRGQQITMDIKSFFKDEPKVVKFKNTVS